MEQPNGKNNELYARVYAADICGLFEELLEEYDITIPSDDRESEDGEARIYGTVYYDLEAKVTEILARLCEDVKAAPDIEINIEDYNGLLDVSSMSKEEISSSIIDLDDKLENMFESEIDENVYQYIKDSPEVFAKIKEKIFEMLPEAIEKYQIGPEIIDGEVNKNCFYNCDAVYMEAICVALEGVVEPVECGRGMITLKANSVDRAIEEAKNRIESSGEKQNSEPDIVKE